MDNKPATEVFVPRGPAGLLVFLRRLPPAPDSDADLLARFVREHEAGGGSGEPPAGSPDGQSAFAALVARHGPMVFAVCRRALSDGADAEDAFQAVFVALAQRAGRVGTVPGWLHRVAVRTARKLAARRKTHAPLPPEAEAPTALDVAERELIDALDAEIDALPERLRAALVLCALQGRTNTEAAVLLGCPVGTVDSRLHAAKQRLRDRLTRRGFTAAAIGAALTATALETARAAESAARLTPAILSAISGGPLTSAVAAILKEMTTMHTRFKLLAVMGAVLAVAGVGFALQKKDPPPPPPMTGTVPRDPATPPPLPDAEKEKDKEKDYQNALVAALHRFAEYRGDAGHLEALLERHPKIVNERETFKQPRKPVSTDDYTALHFAAAAGNTRGVEVLLKYKADVSADAGGGWTPLHYAAQRGNVEVCKQLVAAGAKHDAKTRPRPESVAPSPAPGEKPFVFPAVPALTPLDLAKEGKHKDVIEYLESLKTKTP